jgi:glucosamine-6-phosphate deaminase
MRVHILDSTAETGAFAAGLVLDRLREGALRVLGLATGSSPLPLYAALRASNTAALSGLTAFALDEYVGLPTGHPESYHSVIQREVAIPLGLNPRAVHVPDGTSQDLSAACARYEDDIARAGGVDLQILGIGATGHLGFNEPSSSLASRTRVKTLTPQTRRDNARFFASPDEVPMHCVTQGLGTIMESRELLLIAHGEAKAAAVAAAVEGPLTSMCPASIIQMHPRATVVLDRPAASRLRMLDYYRFVQAHDPAE